MRLWPVEASLLETHPEWTHTTADFIKTHQELKQSYLSGFDIFGEDISWMIFIMRSRVSIKDALRDTELLACSLHWPTIAKLHVCCIVNTCVLRYWLIHNPSVFLCYSVLQHRLEADPWVNATCLKCLQPLLVVKHSSWVWTDLSWLMGTALTKNLLFF
jgi:hypothetical protein